MNADEVRRQWAERSGEYSPEYYAHYGPNETSELLRERLVRLVGRDAAILEVGCSSGRHLAHLLDDGFTNLAGIEINEAALDVMRDSYPELSDAGSFHVGSFAESLPTLADGAFDAIYSVETLQHVHPDDAHVFDELARVTGDLLITMENEQSQGSGEHGDEDVTYVNDEFPLYHRDWSEAFGKRGLIEVESNDENRDTLRVLRHPA